MCDHIAASRRGFLGQVGATGLLAAGWSVSSRGAEVGHTAPEGPGQQLTVHDALDRLIAGNERFLAGKTLHPHDSKPWRDRLRGSQHPFATILACSDSRVPPELLFDQGFGDLFTIRVAGNVIAPDILGSVQYAFAHLNTPLLVILGHTGCGAVTAAVETKLGNPDGRVWIDDLVDLIEPALNGVDQQGSREEVIARSVEANVRYSLNKIKEIPGFQELLSRHQDKRVVGAIYDLDTGKVNVLDRG
jgi:carbonic anhydrase